MLARETGWQMNNIIQDVRRRYPDLHASEDAGERAIHDWLLDVRQRLERTVEHPQ